MVSKGARNLVLLSRRGVNGDTELESFVRNLEGSGARVYRPKCDVSDPESFAMVIEYCKANMPPIKGCIQPATVYRVGLVSTCCSRPICKRG